MNQLRADLTTSRSLLPAQAGAEDIPSPASVRRHAGRRVRVLFCECGHRGGSVKQVVRLIRGLDRARFDVGVFSYYRTLMAAKLFEAPDLYCRWSLPYAPSPAPDMMKPLGRLWLPTPFLAEYAALAAMAILRRRPDLVYLNNLPEQHLPMIWLARRARIPVICHLQATRPLSGPDRIGVPHVSRFLALSRQAREWYVQHGIPADKLDIVYNTVAADAIDAAPVAGPIDGMPDGPIYVVQVATLNDNKRPMLAIKGLEYARRTCPNLRLVLVGDGESRPEIERYIAEHNLRGVVLLLGQRDDIPAILKRSHIGLLVSRREGMPVSVLEYMLARLPVIVTDLPGMDEMVQRDETGVLLSEPDPESLGAAMARLAGDAELRRRMGEAGRHIATQPPFDDRAAIESAERHIMECVNA